MIFLKQMTNDEQQGFTFVLCQEMRVLKTQIPPVFKTTDSLWGWLEPEHECSQSYCARCVLGDRPGALPIGQCLQKWNLKFSHLWECWPELTSSFSRLLDFIGEDHLSSWLIAILLIFELPYWSELKSTFLLLWEPCTSLASFNDKVMNNLIHQDLHSLG